MKKHDSISGLLLAALTIATQSATHAANSLDINFAPAAVAASQVSAKYGITVQLAGTFHRRVTFSIGDADGMGARLDAVNTLANSLGATFTKVYVVTKAAGDAPEHARVDSTARVLFTQTSLSAADAIARIADSDDALAQTVGDIDGSVTLSAPNLPVAQAMNEIAEQTHTSWKTIYVLSPRGARAADARIIGHTAGGSPIIQMSKIFYDNPARDAFWAQEAEKARKLAEQQQQQMLAAQKQASAQTAASGAAPTASTANSAAPYSQRYPNSGYSSPIYNNGSGMMVLGGSGYGNSAVYLGSNAH